MGKHVLMTIINEIHTGLQAPAGMVERMQHGILDHKLTFVHNLFNDMNIIF